MTLLRCRRADALGWTRPLALVAALLPAALLLIAPGAGFADEEAAPEGWKGTISWSISCDDCASYTDPAYIPGTRSNFHYTEAGSITLDGSVQPRNDYKGNDCVNEFRQNFTWQDSYHEDQHHDHPETTPHEWTSSFEASGSGTSAKPYWICVDPIYDGNGHIEPGKSWLTLGHPACEEPIWLIGPVYGECPGTNELWFERIDYGTTAGYEVCEAEPPHKCWYAERPEKLEYTSQDWPYPGFAEHGMTSLILPTLSMPLGTAYPGNLSGSAPFYVTWTGYEGGELHGTLAWDLKGEPKISYPTTCPSPVAHFGATWSQGTDAERFDGSLSSSPFPTKIASWTWDFGDGSSGSGLTPEHVYKEAGEYDATVTTKSDCGAEASYTASVTVNPPVVYAPQVYLDPDEKYLPGDATAFIEGSRLRWDEPQYDGCHDDTVSAHPAPARLGAASPDPYTHSATAVVRHWVILGHAFAHSCSAGRGRVAATDKSSRHGKKEDNAGFVLDGVHASRSGDLSDAPVYAEYEPNSWIIYWFFYPYNGWSTLGGRLVERHEGDWEHMVVQLDGRDHLIGTAYGQHECPLKPRGASFAGTHPIVFSALGGHASYPTNGRLGSGKHVFECTNGWKLYDLPHSALYDTTGKGKVWRTWENVDEVRAEPWYGFGGSWGEVGSSGSLQKCLCFYGPSGPSARKLAGALPDGW